MNINKRGFATSTILFSLLSLFLIAISILLFTMNNSSSLNKSLNDNVVQNIEYGESNVNNIELQLSELQAQVDKLEQNVIDRIYPIGSIYMSTTESTVEQVQERFGGVWQAYSQGTALVGTGTYTDSNGVVTTYNSESTGGSNAVTLTTNNIPSHSHSYTPAGTIKSTFKGTSVATGGQSASHTHTVYGVQSAGTTGVRLVMQNDGNLVLYNTSGSAIWAAGTGGQGTGTKYRYVTIGLDGTTSGPSSDHYHSVTAAGTVASTFTGVSSSTTKCTDCDGTSFSVQNPYTAVYIYKRVE